MLTLETPKTFPAKLRLRGFGEVVELNITFNNRKQSELEAKSTDETCTIYDILLFVINEWDASVTLDTAGLKELEDGRNGICMAIMEGFHRARQTELEKN